MINNQANFGLKFSLPIHPVILRTTTHSKGANMTTLEKTRKGTAFLITHGDRYFGPNPSHTVVGIQQVQNLKIPEVKLIVIGTGKRFQEIYTAIKDQVSDVPIKYSPFCGGVEGLESNGQIILNDGTLVDDENCLGMIKVKAFDALMFIEELIELADGDVLLCAGGELMWALGLKPINQKGHLYELDPETKSGHMIQ